MHSTDLDIVQLVSELQQRMWCEKASQLFRLYARPSCMIQVVTIIWHYTANQRAAYPWDMHNTQAAASLCLTPTALVCVLMRVSAHNLKKQSLASVYASRSGTGSTSLLCTY